MAVDQTIPSDAEIRKWFLDAPSVPDGTFEFALVLGGTVSAGAYTAGAIDFLIEALDCFSAARAGGKAPKHNVILKLIAGTSGGGVNAAIAARALAFQFPHIIQSPPTDGASTANPFYDIWVNTLRLGRFLDTSDITDKLPSFLNGRPIDDGAQQIVTFGNDADAHARDWVAGPLRIILTVTNLRGIPYRMEINSQLSQTYVDHADYLRFAVLYPGQQLGVPRPDEQVLPFRGTVVPQQVDWVDFSLAARATAAFPLGFPARVLSRPTDHYRWRVVPYPGAGAPDTYMVLTPDWQAMQSDTGVVPDLWSFLSVDGGATDNEPIQLARTALAGLLNRNPRASYVANRAVWLIDPFAGKADLGPADATTFPKELGAVVTTLTEQTRYDTSDLLMAGDTKIFSRFMLTPTRTDDRGKLLIGGDAIASAGLGAFIGFACPEFMRFDYLLGRRNCQKFLREEFVLGDQNPLFSGWTNGDRVQFRQQATAGFLPIIPLVGSAAIDAQAEDWPTGALDPETFRGTIEARFRAVFQAEFSGDIGKSALAWIGAQVTQKQAADYIISAMNACLKATDLA
jgi:Patatin-like phospholipase